MRQAASAPRVLIVVPTLNEAAHIARVIPALLGGALGLLARTMDDRAVASVLRNALASVESGELSEARSAPPPGAGPM